MADVFISYARSTAPQAQRIAEALRGLGYQVWRDDELPAHRSYAEVIEERLKAAKAVVVIWSAEAVKSEWVRSEADRARNDRKLVQLSVDGTLGPMPFDQIQCADLSGWSGDLNAPGWRKVVSSVADLVGSKWPAATANVPHQRKGVSICVLPFANMSDDREQEYFSDGISEDIITDLSKVSALHVISRNTAFTFKGKHVDLRKVVSQLGVTHVLEGSVRKSGGRVRITAQLIEGSIDGHVWAERYDRDLNDIFALQDEISEAIVKALKLKLLPEEKKAIEDRGTKNLEAYDFYLRGNSVYAQMGYENTIRAAELLRNALALDPAFSLARRSLARILRVLIYVTPVDRTSARQELEDLIEGGILEAKDLALSHYWRGVQNMRRHDWFGAEQAFDRSLSLSPASETGLIDSRFELLLYVGRMTDAVDLGRELVRDDPLSLIQSTWLQATLSALGRAREEEIEFERTRTLSGDHMAIELTRLQRIWPDSAPAERRNQLQRILASGVFTSGYVLRLEDVFDQPNAARGVLRQAFADLRDKAVTDVMRIALLAGLFSDIELALDCLNRAYVDLDFPEGNRLWAPAFAEARKRPRFKDLIRELGIYDYWRKSGKWGDFARAKGDDDFEITR